MFEILVIATLIGLIPAVIARSKGRSFGAWWFYGAALFIVALPHALLLRADSGRIEAQALADPANRKCPFCAEIIKAEAKVCRFCGRDIPASSQRPAVLANLGAPYQGDRADRPYQNPWQR